MIPSRDDLRAAAEDELARACTLAWRQLAEITPWGDTFEGVTPGGREARGSGPGVH